MRIIRNEQIMERGEPLRMSEANTTVSNEKLSLEKQEILKTEKYMFDILLLLAAPTVMAWYYYGSRALWLISVSVITAIFTELTVTKVIKSKPCIQDLSSIATAVSIALCLPASSNWWLPCIAVVFAIAVVKLPFGNSRNIMFLPAAAGLAFITICFPDQVFAYPVISQNVENIAVFGTEDFVKGDSIAFMLSQGNSIGVNLINYIDLAVGNVSGPMGAACALAMLGGLIYTLFRRPKSAVISISFLLTCAIYAFLFPRISTDRIISVVMELSGGLVFFTAIVFLTNETIAPKRFISRLFYGVCGGLVTMLLRTFSPFEDSTVFAVLLMNSVATVFDSKIPVIGLEKKHLLKQIEETKQEQKRLEEELENVEKAKEEEKEIAEINAKLEPKRSMMVQKIADSIQSSTIAEIEAIPDEVIEEPEEINTPNADTVEGILQEVEKVEETDDDIATFQDISSFDDSLPTLQDINDLLSKYELDINEDGGDSDE